MLWPVGVALIATAVLFATGIIDKIAVAVAIFLILTTTAVTLFEYHRGAMARVRTHNEIYPLALYTLFGRNRRRYGGYMIHLGVIVMAIGIIGSQGYQLETQRPVAAGQTITLGNYVLEYQTLERFVATDGRSVMRAQADVYRNGRLVGHVTPRIDSFSGGETATIPSTITTLTGDDFYVVLVAWEPTSLSSATFKVYLNPLVNWIWGGGFIFILGTLIAAWPDWAEERREVRSTARLVGAAGDK
jgi:cytochrome c-type biogenesis protein CcmF